MRYQYPENNGNPGLKNTTFFALTPRKYRSSRLFILYSRLLLHPKANTPKDKVPFSAASL